MDKKLFVRQNPKDFAKGGFYLSFQKSFKRLIGITGFFLLFLFMNVPMGYAQQPIKISLNLQNATFEEVFNAIEKQTGYKFVYNTSDIDRTERVSIQESDQELSQILQSLLRNKGDISFRISNKHIALFKKQVKPISGTVFDSRGESVIGANILIKVDLSPKTVSKFRIIF